MRGSVSLILPMTPGATLSRHEMARYRRILLDEAGLLSIDVIVVRHQDDGFVAGQDPEEFTGLATEIRSDASDWPGLVRAGLRVATGEQIVVLDLNRHYTAESLGRVLNWIRTADYDLAVAVPCHRRLSLQSWVRSRLGPALFSRMMLGTADVSSGLFALRRFVWDGSSKQETALGSNLVLDSLLRRQARSIDVPVDVDGKFQSRRIGLSDLRSLKRILDGRFGNYSRLVQFCMVGASGMVVDLSFYALLQFLLSFTWLAQQESALFGEPWHLAIAAAMSIAIALVWNFTLNRRLTFNDAHKGALGRQFLTYVLSNALAIVLSFSVRLYLPAHVDFFARHRLAAAVVGIVAATGVSFSMSRWLVFGRRSELTRTAHFPLETSAVGQPTSVP